MQISNMFRSLPPVTKNLLIINVIIWVFLNICPISTVDKFINFCALHYFTAETFNPAQIVTYMFVHKDFMHLFFNMFALFMFGMVIERTLGSKRFLFYYVSCGIGAALIQEGVFAIMIARLASHFPDGTVALISARNSLGLEQLVMQHPEMYAYLSNIAPINELINIPVIGASGAVFGILLAFGYLFPRQPIYLMFIPIPIQARWMVLGYGVLELLQGISNRAGDNVAHFAHIGGMIFGFLMLLYWKKKGVFRRDRWY